MAGRQLQTHYTATSAPVAQVIVRILTDDITRSCTKEQGQPGGKGPSRVLSGAHCAQQT